MIKFIFLKRGRKYQIIIKREELDLLLKIGGVGFLNVRESTPGFEL